MLRRLSLHQKGILAILAANLIWGAAPSIFKLALQNIAPFTLAFIRFYGAMLFLFPFVLRKPWIAKRDWFELFLTTLFGIVANISFLFLGLRMSPSINASIIATSGPIFLYILSILVLHEKPKSKILVGILVSLVGVLLVIGQPILVGNFDGELLGNFLFLLSTLGAVGHIVVSKKLLLKYPPFLITFWTFFIAAHLFMPLFLYEALHHASLQSLDYRGYLGIGFGTLLSSLAAYTLFDWGRSKLITQEVGLFAYIDPVAATIFATFLLGETITPVFFVATILVFIGISIAEGKLHYHLIPKLWKE